MLAKGCIGYEKRLSLGMCTHVSGHYLLGKLQEINEFEEEEYNELLRLFQLFERNIDKPLKQKILELFTRE